MIVTNRPAIANSWYEDYAKFIGREGGYFFVSSVDGVKDRPLVISMESYKTDEKSSGQIPTDTPTAAVSESTGKSNEQAGKEQ